ncbi:MAG: sensor histidine kinase [Galactobacter sp.]
MPHLPHPLHPARLFAMPGVPADWERPGPTRSQRISDVVAAVVWFGVAYLTWWLSNQLAVTTRLQSWEALVGLGAQCGLLAIRRSHPLTCLLAASVIFVGVSSWQPGLAYQLSFQAAYFAALYAAAAWTKDTRAFRACIVGVLVGMGLWLVIGATLLGAYEQISNDLADLDSSIPPFTAWFAYSVIINMAFFSAALFFGRRARAGAWQHQQLVEQSRQLKEQASELARRAVVDERLRIARELHDVVAHHISAVGIQAAAARRVQAKNPAMSADLLTQVEGSARSALAETRALLGVLRAESEPVPDAASAPPAPSSPSASPAVSRAPEPGLADVSALVQQMDPEVGVEITRIEAADLRLADVPAHLGLTVYRVVQEALTNVRRHSTARTATVTLRTGHDEVMGDWVEAEVLDSGRALPSPRGPAGSGYGLAGIGERAALHAGVAEIGPRSGSAGFRVRLRVPLSRPEPPAEDSSLTAPPLEETP